jgi:argininosuccinate synthase
MFMLTKSPQEAPDRETEITIEFDEAVPVGLDGERLPPLEILERLNRLGAENGIGRSDLVENRTVGMKSRGVYETPAGTILYTALRELEMLTMDAETIALKSSLGLRYGELVYRGKWFTTIRESIDAFMRQASEYVTGSIRLVLYKGNVIVAGRKSPYSLYMQDIASFGESSYDHKDATGFINLYGLSTGVAAMVHKGIHGTSGQAGKMQGTAATYHEK